MHASVGLSPSSKPAEPPLAPDAPTVPPAVAAPAMLARAEAPPAPASPESLRPPAPECAPESEAELPQPPRMSAPNASATPRPTSQLLDPHMSFGSILFVYRRARPSNIQSQATPRRPPSVSLNFPSR